jgi:hypothetical protein
MKDLVAMSMVFTLILGFAGMVRLVADSKWFIIGLFLYSVGALLTLGMVIALYQPDKPIKPKRGKMYVEKTVQNTPSFSKYV